MGCFFLLKKMIVFFVYVTVSYLLGGRHLQARHLSSNRHDMSTKTEQDSKTIGEAHDSKTTSTTDHTVGQPFKTDIITLPGDDSYGRLITERLTMNKIDLFSLSKGGWVSAV